MYVKKGFEFLSDISVRILEDKYNQEANAKAKIRLQCAVLRKKGKSIPFISGVVGKRESTVRKLQWAKPSRDNGIDESPPCAQSASILFSCA